jgi:hypothetical protein
MIFNLSMISYLVSIKRVVEEICLLYLIGFSIFMIFNLSIISYLVSIKRVVEEIC